MSANRLLRINLGSSQSQLFWAAPRTSVHGIPQSRMLGWVVISFSGGSSKARDWSHISCIGRGVLYHQATWEALLHTLAQYSFQQFLRLVLLGLPGIWFWFWFLCYLFQCFDPVLGASPVAQLVKNPPAMRETWVPLLRWENPLGKGMATHSSILAWRIPWTQENSMESQIVGYEWATFTSFHFTHILFAPCLPSLPTSNCSSWVCFLLSLD